MSTTTDDSASPQAELPQLNDSNVENDGSQQQQDESNNIGSQHNLTCTNPMDTTVVNFDETLPPGVAPAGFVVLDEDNDAANRSQQLVSSQDSGVADEGDKEVTKEPEKKNVVQQQPVVKVVFRETSLLKKYRSRIETFLKSLLHPEYKKKKLKSTTSDVELSFYDSDGDRPSSRKSKSSRFSDEFDSDRPSSKKKKSSHSLDVADSRDYSKENQSNDALFMVDTQPKYHDDLDVPIYGKKFHKALQKGSAVEEKEDTGPKMTCFNCLGNHSLRECDQPRNPHAINRNRKDYNAKRGPMNARYHLEDDQKFGHFVPGQISPTLRKALGLKENELPRHIYRMRQLGYPPGWLEQARLQHSGLVLFGNDGSADGGSDEEGEIVLPGDKDKFDIKKIIDFPGFNIPTPRGIRDEEETQYWGSLMQEQNSKEAMLLHLSHKKADDGYKRRKMPNPANMRSSTDLNPGEMDVDEVEDTPAECLPVHNYFIPPLPREEGPELPPPPPPPPAETEDSVSHSQEDVSSKSPNVPNDENPNVSPQPESPSLLELENAKKQLLAELDESSSNSNSEFTKNGVPKADTPVTKVPEQSVDADSSQPNTPKSDSEKNDTMESESKADDSVTNKFNANSLEVTPKNSPKPLHKAVTETHFGTPILHSVSPFKRLPSAEKFSKDICDVINFENLPDSTGKYDQMSGLLKKVRIEVARMQKE